MILHFFWLIPFCLFAISFFKEPRKLLNAFLLTLSLFNCFIVTIGLLIVRLESFNHYYAIGLFYTLLACIPIITLVSTVYLFFNGRQMIQLEGLALANTLSLIYGMVITLAIIVFFLPIDKTPFWLFYTLLAYGSFIYVAHIIYTIFLNLIPIRRQFHYIIVLGSGLLNGDTVPPLLAKRLDKAIKLYNKAIKKPIIITSGGQGRDETVSESLAMSHYLIEKGIPKQAILLEDKSTTTFENLSFSKQIIEQYHTNYRVIVTTNSFHSLRANIYMKNIGIPGRCVGAKTAFYYLPSAYIREVIALVVMYKKWYIGFLIMYLLFIFGLDLLNAIIQRLY